MSSQIPQEQLECAGTSHKAKAEEQAFPMPREENAELSGAMA